MIPVRTEDVKVILSNLYLNVELLFPDKVELREYLVQEIDKRFAKYERTGMLLCSIENPVQY